MDDSDACIETAVANFDGWKVCLPNAALKSVVYGKGAGAPSQVKTKPSMKEAYEMGKNI